MFLPSGACIEIQYITKRNIAFACSIVLLVSFVASLPLYFALNLPLAVVSIIAALGVALLFSIGALVFFKDLTQICAFEYELKFSNFDIYNKLICFMLCREMKFDEEIRLDCAKLRNRDEKFLLKLVEYILSSCKDGDKLLLCFVLIDISDDNFKELFKLLESSNIHGISFVSISLSDSTLQDLSNLLKNTKSIEYFSISLSYYYSGYTQKNFTLQGSSYLKEGLQQNNTIKKCSFYRFFEVGRITYTHIRNHYHAARLAEMVKGVEQNQSIKVFILRWSNNIWAIKHEYRAELYDKLIYSLLVNNKTIQELDFSENIFTYSDQPSKIFADGLKLNTTLNSITLYSYNSSYIQALALGLSENISIVKASFSWIRNGEIKQSCKKNRKIQQALKQEYLGLLFLFKSKKFTFSMPKGLRKNISMCVMKERIKLEKKLQNDDVIKEFIRNTLIR